MATRGKRKTSTEASSAEEPKKAKGADLPPLVELKPTEDGATLSSCVAISGLDGSKIMMPWVGFGTYRFKGTNVAQRAVSDALSIGYRLVDTAFAYGGEKTEGEVGRAIKAYPRDQIFVTTKHWRAYHGYDATMKCLDLSLSRLGVDYIDLWLIHWPGPAYHTMARRKDVIEEAPEGAFVYAKEGHDRESLPSLRAETWRAMEDALKAGKCRAIGVSNFSVSHLRTLRKTATVWPPAVNQVELHPYHQQRELQEYCKEEGIVLQAYASLGGQDSGKQALQALGGHLLANETVVRIAEKHGVSSAQVLLKWALQKGFPIIPKSKSRPRMEQNADVFANFTLDDEDMESLDGLEQPAEVSRLCWKSDPLKNLDFE